MKKTLGGHHIESTPSDYLHQVFLLNRMHWWSLGEFLKTECSWGSLGFKNYKKWT
jgi:hypothetical protein